LILCLLIGIKDKKIKKGEKNRKVSNERRTDTEKRRTMSELMKRFLLDNRIHPLTKFFLLNYLDAMNYSSRKGVKERMWVGVKNRLEECPHKPAGG